MRSGGATMTVHRLCFSPIFVPPLLAVVVAAPNRESSTRFPPGILRLSLHKSFKVGQLDIYGFWH
jgi:hypothetical protein